jgi:hypothetical protein
MNEREWVSLIRDRLAPQIAGQSPALSIEQGHRLPYASEIRSYQQSKPLKRDLSGYETDLLIKEELADGSWMPRIVIEAKLHSVTTHDAITYSEKAINHKKVHPYLRYGIILGDRKHYPLPGRLYRHGAYFDFMVSWRSYDPSSAELTRLRDLLLEEAGASRDLEEILYSSRKPDRKKYTLLHRPLRLAE